MSNQKLQKRLKKASGNVRLNGKLESFLYELMRDHVTPGKVQAVLDDSQEPDVEYTNGFLAKYARFVAKQLK